MLEPTGRCIFSLVDEVYLKYPIDVPTYREKMGRKQKLKPDYNHCPCDELSETVWQPSSCLLWASSLGREPMQKLDVRLDSNGFYAQ